VRFHTQTAGVSLTAQQPENNVVRVCDPGSGRCPRRHAESLHTNSLDEALRFPSEHAVTIALRTQQIIAEESGVTNTVDPLGGSFFVEALTDRMEKEAYDYFRRVEEMGGVIPAIEKGFFQSEISDAAYRYQREIDRGIRKIVGVNAYAEKKPLTIPILEMDPQGYQRQVKRLEDLRKTRDNGRVGQTLDRLRIALEGTENTMPHIMEAVHAYATLGEIIQVMKEAFGVYEEPTMI
jgi:methylmalonyl-CoA mutase N-terminal domain/subunit